MRSTSARITAMLLPLALAGCFGGPEEVEAESPGGNVTPTPTPTPSPTPTVPSNTTGPAPTANLTVRSPAFAQGAAIPRENTCDGRKTSPPLVFEGLPAAAGSIALVVHDPDAGASGFTHWVVFNLPGNTTGLPEDAKVAPLGATEGRNGLGRVGWLSPCPPSGTHRYEFRVYALDGPLDLSRGATAAELEEAMKGRILSQGKLVGTYQRPK